VVQGDGGDHRIGGADGLADAFQLARDAARQLNGGPTATLARKCCSCRNACFWQWPCVVSISVTAESVRTP
jgi:hypothetical protein